MQNSKCWLNERRNISWSDDHLLPSDIDSLLRLSNRARDTGIWDPHDLSFCEVTFEQVLKVKIIMNISFQLSVWTGIEGDDHPEYHLSNIHDPLASVTRLCCDSFADWESFLQIFGGVEDTHKTLVKKATHKTPERDKEKEEERGSSVYDSRSSLRRWLRENSLSIGNMETRYWLLLFLVIGQNSCHIGDQLWH